MNQLRPENLAVRVKTDVHAPSFLRVNGPVTEPAAVLRRVTASSRAIKMYRADSVRVKIW